MPVSVTRGVSAIRNASTVCKDGLFVKLEGLSNICVHEDCRKNYTRTDTTKQRYSSFDSGVSESVTRLRSQYTGPLDYKTDCWGKLINERLSDSKQPH